MRSSMIVAAVFVLCLCVVQPAIMIGWDGDQLVSDLLWLATRRSSNADERRRSQQRDTPTRTIQNDRIPVTENQLFVVVGGATMFEYALILALKRSPFEKNGTYCR